MRLNSNYIFTELGCKREEDMFGGIFAFYEGGHFYPKDLINDEWVFHYDEPKGRGEVIHTVEEFEYKLK